MFTFAEEYLLKSSVLKNMTDSYEGEKIASMIQKHFRATGAYEAVQGLSDLILNTFAE